MKMVRTKGFAIILVMALVLCSANVGFAQDPAKKLGRGLGNILTGWVELPKNIYDTSVQQNVLAGLTMGLAKGVGMTIVRTGAGAYETVTFPFPLPENYKPLIEPEFVFQESK